MSIKQLVSNVIEILGVFIKDDIYYIDEAIEEYDNKNGGVNNDILEKRKKIIFNHISAIEKSVKNEKFDDVEKLLVKLFNYIKDDYYKSTISNYQRFRDYNHQLKAIQENFRYILYNIDRYQNGKSLEEVYPTYHKNFKADVFKLNIPKSKSLSSGVSSYVSSVSGVDDDYYLKYLKTNVKVIRKYMKVLVTMVKEAIIKKNINSLLKTNILDKKFVSLYEKICKSLEKNKDEKVKKVLMKLKKINITHSIDEFNKHLETERIKHIQEFKRGVLSSFFTMKLTKSRTIPFI
jgi:hypothetical protein